jgi:peptide-methionine (S)-S-oxide reductase
MENNNTQVAVFGGGCFWCTEAVFEELRGVISVMPGYTGGTVHNPSYDAVCGGNTGHAEATRIEFDPAQISFKDLLTVFFATHDPTTLNRQGNDVGTQYRSAIFYSTPEQKTESEQFIKDLEASDPGGKPIVTEVTPLGEFYDAEDYHRQYYKNNPGAGYCQVIIEPKVQKMQEHFSALLKSAAK